MPIDPVDDDDVTPPEPHRLGRLEAVPSVSPYEILRQQVVEVNKRCAAIEGKVDLSLSQSSKAVIGNEETHALIAKLQELIESRFLMFERLLKPLKSLLDLGDEKL